MIENVTAHERVPWASVCYHAQQVAEKMLKAYLVAHEQVPPKTHDLISLVKLCNELGAHLDDLIPDCKFILRWGAAARYPGERLEPNQQQGGAAVAAAKRVRARLLELLTRLVS